MKLRIIESQWNSFVDGLRSRSDVETAGIVLAERLHGGDVLLARHMIEVPADGYLIRRGDQLRLDPIVTQVLSTLRRMSVPGHPLRFRPGTWFTSPLR